MVMDIKYNCGCNYELDVDSRGPYATKIGLCSVHKLQITPPQPDEEIGGI